MAAKKRVSAIRRKAGKNSGYGWVPDLPDHRDFIYRAALMSVFIFW